jgi:hypothetical protein
MKVGPLWHVSHLLLSVRTVYRLSAGTCITLAFSHLTKKSIILSLAISGTSPCFYMFSVTCLLCVYTARNPLDSALTSFSYRNNCLGISPVALMNLFISFLAQYRDRRFNQATGTFICTTGYNFCRESCWFCKSIINWYDFSSFFFQLVCDLWTQVDLEPARENHETVAWVARQAL